MILINLIGWLIFGLIIGIIAKAITPGKEPDGWVKTICIGILGSYFGGIIKYIISGLENNLEPSGIIFSILGSVMFLLIWKKMNVK